MAVACAPDPAPEAEKPATPVVASSETRSTGIQRPRLSKTPSKIANIQREWKLCSKMGELCSIRLENAETDAERALRAGDRRVLGIWGYSISFPGLTVDDYAEARGAYRGIEGTSDMIEGQKHSELIDYATDYAAIYNGFIVKNRDKYR